MNELNTTIAERELQLEGDCPTLAALNTTYNRDERVPPYMGVMFEVFPKVDFELLTLELDVRIPKGVQNPDLSIEVYTMKGSFEAKEAYDYDPSTWHLLAQTTGVLVPGGTGLIIPAQDFTTLALTRGSRRSFYITMKEPYIDHNVMALQKTNEIQLQTEDLQLNVGVGFHEYKFPGDFDRTLDPQFAGVFHYRKMVECVRAVETTAVSYQFLIEQETTPQLVQEVNRYMDDAVKEILQDNTVLKSYQKYYALQKYQETSTDARKFEGKCPGEWTVCPAYLTSSSMSFAHRDSLSSGALTYELYRDVEFARKYLMEQLPPDTDVLYTGLGGISAEMTLTLTGVPEGTLMNELELTYFTEVATNFLKAKTEGTAAFVFAVEISEQAIQSPGNLRMRRLQSGNDVLEIKGRVLGGQSTSLSANSFKNAVEGVMLKYQPDFLTRLKFDSLRPSEVNPDGTIEYFDGVSGARTALVVDEVAKATSDSTAQEPASGLDSSIFVAIGAGIGLIGLIALVMFVRGHLKRSAENKKDKEHMKEMRKEREKADRMIGAAVARQRAGSFDNTSLDGTDNVRTVHTASDGSSTGDKSHDTSEDDNSPNKTQQRRESKSADKKDAMRTSSTEPSREVTNGKAGNEKSAGERSIPDRKKSKSADVDLMRNNNLRNPYLKGRSKSFDDAGDLDDSKHTGPETGASRYLGGPKGRSKQTLDEAPQTPVRSRDTDEDGRSGTPRRAPPRTMSASAPATSLGKFFGGTSGDKPKSLGSSQSVMPTPTSSLGAHAKFKATKEAEDISRSSPRRKAPSRTKTAPIAPSFAIGSYSAVSAPRSKNSKKPADNKKDFRRSSSFDDTKASDRKKSESPSSSKKPTNHKTFQRSSSFDEAKAKKSAPKKGKELPKRTKSEAVDRKTPKANRKTLARSKSMGDEDSPSSPTKKSRNRHADAGPTFKGLVSPRAEDGKRGKIGKPSKAGGESKKSSSTKLKKMKELEDLAKLRSKLKASKDTEDAATRSPRRAPPRRSKSTDSAGLKHSPPTKPKTSKEAKDRKAPPRRSKSSDSAGLKQASKEKKQSKDT